MNKFGLVREMWRERGPLTAAKKSGQQLLTRSSTSSYLKSLLGKTLHQKMYMYLRLGYWPTIREPTTFNEKIMHRKLYTDNDLFPIIADKYRVREYVAKRVGEDLLSELYHVTDDPETIPFADLPSTYVIKPTHMSGTIRFVDESEEPEVESIEDECREWLGTEYGSTKEEYWYGEIRPRILIEERLKDDEYGIPPDFKFFVFHGEVKYIQVDMNRYTDHTRRFYDREWNPQEFGLKFPLGPKISEPENLDTMIDIAEKLGEGLDFIRVDLYQIDGERVVFGEMTIAPESGGGEFIPREYDLELGSLW